MYQFSTTNVINSAYAVDQNGVPMLDSAGNQISKFTGSATAFNVVKVGNFLKDNIVSFYKRPYKAGVLEVAQLVVPSATAGDILRLTVLIKLTGSTQSEYTNYSLDFQKPVSVEILSSGTAATDATAIVAQLNGLKNRFGHSYITASANSATITLTAKEYVQHFKSILLEKLVESTNSISQIDNTVVATGTVTTPGSLGFGDDTWMVTSIMLPTAENVRFFGISKEERPVLGGNYSEYVLRYSVEKDGTDGIVAGGKSITTHVFYVISSQVSNFEAEIANVGLTVPALFTYTVSDSSLANSATATSSTTGAIGTVVYSVTSGTSATVNATTGVITAHATTDGNTVIRATDSVGNYDEVTITVA